METMTFPFAPGAAESKDLQVALRLADLLRAARNVIAENQDLINDPTDQDKGLTGKRVIDQAAAIFQRNYGVDPRSADAATREGRLFRVQVDVRGKSRTVEIFRLKD